MQHVSHKHVNLWNVSSCVIISKILLSCLLTVVVTQMLFMYGTVVALMSTFCSMCYIVAISIVIQLYSCAPSQVMQLWSICNLLMYNYIHYHNLICFVIVVVPYHSMYSFTLS
jgi:hypothetical protein